MEEINEIISAVTAKAAVHETQFPKDLENAYELGRELVRQAQEE